MVFRNYELLRSNRIIKCKFVGGVDGSLIRIGSDIIEIRTLDDDSAEIKLNPVTASFIVDAIKSVIRSDGYAYGGNNILMHSYMDESGERLFEIEISDNKNNPTIHLTQTGIENLLSSMRTEYDFSKSG